MAKITIPDIASQFASQEALNARFTQVENELNDKVLYRDNPDGEPNAMAQELDMNTNRIINLPEPVSPNDAARLQDVQTATLDPDTIILTQTESVSLTAGQRTVDFPTYPTTGASFNVSGPNVDDARLVLGRDLNVASNTSVQLTQSYPAGTVIQLLRNAVSGEAPVGVSFTQSEAVTLTDSQTVVSFAIYSTEYAGFYVSGNDIDSGRLSTGDYILISNTSIELVQSYPAGTVLTLLRNSTEGDGVDTPIDAGGGRVDTIVAGTNVTVDSADPANPIVSSTAVSGGQVDSIVAGTNVTIDNSDPANPIVSSTVAAGASALDDLTDVSTAGVASGQVLKYNGASWAPAADISGGAGAANVRASYAGTTGALADLASTNLDIVGAKSYSLMKVTVDEGAAVTIYVDEASRTADAGRDILTDPATDAGIVAEVISTAASTVVIAPGAFGFNNELTPTTNIPCRVINTSGLAVSAIVVTLDVLALEV